MELYDLFNSTFLSFTTSVFAANLEVMFRDILDVEEAALSTTELSEANEFDRFLEPNEINVRDIQEVLHRNMTMPGIIVSVGTVRSFADLALAPENCEGLVVRDVNPKVKAWVDFETMLLKISDNIEEYNTFLSFGETANWTNPAWIRIKWKLAESPHVSDSFKKYYRQNFERLAKVYYRAQAWRRDNLPKMVNYHRDRASFERLQRYARNGSIIATVGSIGEVGVFTERIPLALIDSSNVNAYAIIEYNCPANIPIIYTEGFKLFHKTTETTYLVEKHQPLSAEEKDNLLRFFADLRE